MKSSVIELWLREIISEISINPTSGNDKVRCCVMAISKYELRRYHTVVEKDAKCMELMAVHREIRISESGVGGECEKHLRERENQGNFSVHHRLQESPKRRAEKEKGVQRSRVLASTSGNTGDEDDCIVVEKAPARKEKCVTTNCEKAEESQCSVSADSNVEEFDEEYSGGLAQQSSVRKQSILAVSSPLELETSHVLLEDSTVQRLKTASVCTRSLTEAMRGVENRANVEENSGLRKSGRKLNEAFVSWNKKTPLQEVQGIVNNVQAESRGRMKTKVMSSSTISGTPQSNPVAISRAVSGEERGTVRPMGVGGTPKRVMTTSTNSKTHEGGTPTGRTQGRMAYSISAGKRPAAGGGGELLTGGGLSVKSVSKTSMHTVPEEIFIRNKKHRLAGLQGVQSREEQQKGGNATEDGNTWPRTGRASSSLRGRIHGKGEVGEKLESPVNEINEEDPLLLVDEEYAEDSIRSCHRRPQWESVPALCFNNDNGNDNYVSDNDGHGDAFDVVEERGQDKSHDEDDMQVLMYPSEAEKRKERRKERAWLEKEGGKRQKEGRPRNFLLVDECTKVPYGVGVGDWRKELMLLSRDLDPSVGNINRQPEGAVAEIADWIQHTWEYSSPVKFEYIKEVVARGVTLRRVDLWKKLRNGEPKPSGLSDRTWRTLDRQLDNPASIQKSENCRKANASRVNFGRTGPSGEVGVRQRLRRSLRRSPDPEEIMAEMARDKGYGGRRQMKEENLNVMHGSGVQRRLCKGGAYSEAPTGNSDDDNSSNGDGEFLGNASDKVDVGHHAVASGGVEVVGGSVSSMSVEQISQHPFVAMMMQRLEALEDKQTCPVLEDIHDPSVDVHSAEEEVQGNDRQLMHTELEDAAHAEDAEGNGQTQTSRRNTRKAKRG